MKKRVECGTAKVEHSVYIEIFLGYRDWTTNNKDATNECQSDGRPCIIKPY